MDIEPNIKRGIRMTSGVLVLKTHTGVIISMMRGGVEDIWEESLGSKFCIY